MKRKVEVINNPYQQKVRILLDGKAVSSYSELEQYQDEPFWNWCETIIEIVYKECNYSEFILRYSGREEENHIFSQISKKYSYCEYVFVPFKNNVSFQQRLKMLNKMIANNGIKVKQKNIRAMFVVSSRYKKYSEEISGINVENRYCKVEPLVYDAGVSIGKNDIVFVVGKDNNVADLSVRYNGRFVFGINIGDDFSFNDKSGRYMVYTCKENELFQCIFGCLLLIPLLKAFVETIEDIKKQSRNANANYLAELSEVQSVEIPLSVDIHDDTIELGKSVPIKILSEGRRITDHLLFEYSSNNIIFCNGMRIEGVGEGETILFVVREGENFPFFQKKIRVIKTNPITKISFEESQLVVGVGDSFLLNYNFIPVDADNAEDVKFKSSDEQIASVDNKGKVTAIRKGECEIYVYAGQISDYTRVAVKEYMKSLVPNIDRFDLVVGDVAKIEYTYEPFGCIDGKISINSEDLQIVNIIGNEIRAVSPGDTKLVLSNESKRIVQYVDVSVREKAKRRPQKKFLSRIFGNK